jgi:hypothetical protein
VDQFEITYMLSGHECKVNAYAVDEKEACFKVGTYLPPEAEYRGVERLIVINGLQMRRAI